MTGWIFDDTALIALFNYLPAVAQVWEYAEAEAVPVLYPAAAIHAANVHLEQTDNAWAVLLDRPNATVLELTMAGALAASRRSDNLVLGHVIVEALDTSAIVVTAKPLEYPPEVRTREFHGF